MDTTSFLEQIRPRAYARYQALPLFGAVIADFSAWLSARGYRTKTIKSQLKGVRYVERWLRRKGRRRLSDVTDADVRMAHHRFRTDSNVGGPIRSLGQFLRERGLIVATPPTNPSFIWSERERFGQYLRAVRGFAESSILHHQRLLAGWLSFREADKYPAKLNEITADTIEAYLRLSAKTNNRFSLQHVVANLRAYLRWQHAEGRLLRPLHEEIDAPRCYRLEKLPRALPWKLLMALLRSIERSAPRGHRDFALLYLAAYYGLRSHELVAIKLEDIDWRAATLRIHQRKTKQSLLLPLTDEAGAILARYLREARPASSRRELFLRARAPMGALQPTAVHDILDARIRRSGLSIRMTGTHLLRHSFALHLLRQRAAGRRGWCLSPGQSNCPESSPRDCRRCAETISEVRLPLLSNITSRCDRPWDAAGGLKCGVSGSGTIFWCVIARRLRSPRLSDGTANWEDSAPRCDATGCGSSVIFSCFIGATIRGPGFPTCRYYPRRALTARHTLSCRSILRASWPRRNASRSSTAVPCGRKSCGSHFCCCIAAACGWASCSACACATTTRVSGCCASTKPSSINRGSFRSIDRWRENWMVSSHSGRRSIGGSSRISPSYGVAAPATQATESPPPAYATAGCGCVAAQGS